MAKNKVQCPSGHYYNADKFEECPTCNPNVVLEYRAEEAQTPKRITTASQSEIKQTSSAPEPIIKKHSGAYPRTESAFSSQNEIDMPISIITEETASAFQSTPVQDELNPDLKEQSQEPFSCASSSLQAAVNAVVSHKDKEDVKTIAMWNAPVDSEPAVGWLVCVKGEYFGQSFTLKNGNNSVGRAMNMDIHLAQEESVSRNTHCRITFEPISQSFYIQQGESSGLTYLNGEMVMAPTKMKEKDRLIVGQAEFLLIPLCADGFRWEDYIA